MNSAKKERKAKHKQIIKLDNFSIRAIKFDGNVSLCIQCYLYYYSRTHKDKYDSCQTVLLENPRIKKMADEYKAKMHTEKLLPCLLFFDKVYFEKIKL